MDWDTSFSSNLGLSKETRSKIKTVQGPNMEAPYWSCTGPNNYKEVILWVFLK